MKQQLREAIELEMYNAIHFYNKNDLNTAFYHLERAHILGQSYIIPHTKSHWWMLKIAAKKDDFRGIFGQLTRIFASILFSKIWVPLGNTGGTNVNPLKPMSVPADLKEILDKNN